MSIQRDLVIVGDGGHAKVIIDIFLAAGIKPMGCTGLNPSHTDLLGIKVVGNDDCLPQLFAAGIRQAFVAIGDNRKRLEMTRVVRDIGFSLVNAISPHALVSQSARIGDGVAVMPGAIVNADADLGDGVIVNTGATVDHDCIIGPHAHIAPGTNLAGAVRVGEGVLLGVGTRVVPGVTIGEWSVVGAGSVVIRDLPSDVTAAGNPASIIKRQKTGMNGSRIYVAQPLLTGNEKKYVNECLDTGWLASGRFLGEFEKQFAEYCGVKHAICCSNGTSALHALLLGLGVGPGDEVLVPALTYVATANAVRYCGATPVLIDSEPVTMNIDPARIEAKITPRTKGIIVVHLYGHPADMQPIHDLMTPRGLFVLEDAAEAHGAEYKGKRAGSLGAAAMFSFYGNKIITCGEGGMVTTSDSQLAARVRMIGGQGMDPKRRYWFPIVGYNFRMTNLQAAVGLAQLEQIEIHLGKRRQVADWYRTHLADLHGMLTLPHEASWAKHSFWMYTVLLNEHHPLERGRFMEALDRAGIETRPVFYPMHLMPPYREPDGKYPIAESLSGRGVNLPTHGMLTEEGVIFIAAKIRETCVRRSFASAALR